MTELSRPFRRLVIDIRDVFEPAVAHHVHAVLFEQRLALERRLLAVGRAERDARRTQRLEGGEDAAESGGDGCAALSSQALHELGLGTPAERVAGGGVGEHDDVGFDHGEQLRAFADMRDLRAVALLLSVERARRSMRDHAREMNRNPLGRHCDHFRLNRRIPRGNEEAEPDVPCHDDVSFLARAKRSMEALGGESDRLRRRLWRKVFRPCSLLAMNIAGAPFFRRRAANGEMEMNAPKLQAAENDLKQLMADVTRAMEKAQEAVARMAAKAAAPTTGPESAASPCASSEAAPSG